MKTIGSLTALCAVLVLLLAPVPAPAATVSECQAAIAALSAETDQVIYTNDRDRLGLQAKLAAAAAKLDALKLGDAVQKLGDYASKVNALVAAGKIAASVDGLTTPDQLVDDAAAAAACVGQLGQ